MKIQKVRLSEIVFDETIYPRKEHNPSKVQEYAENLEAINKAENFIIVDSKLRLLDGRHRHLANLKVADGDDVEISVKIREDVSGDKEAYIESIKYNNSHGQQLSSSDKKQNASKMYLHGYSLDTIAKELSITKRTAQNATKDIRDKEKADRKDKIFNMFLACYTQQEIADEVELARTVISDEFKNLVDFGNLSKSDKDLANFDDSVFETPIYNIWTFAKKTNQVSHFGNTEVRIVENLLYLYTKPFSIVIDPFGGGGSTIDVCKKRMRRYYVSDRKPIVERKHEIRLLDITEELPPMNNRWSDVDLVYLDPPYWKQAENQYSSDSEDLANQDIDTFNNNLSNVVNSFADKMKSGSHVALIIQPTQWKSENKRFTDHVLDMCKLASDKLELENRISVPYSTQQYTPQMVNYAKENKMCLALTRELIIWKVK